DGGCSFLDLVGDIRSATAGVFSLATNSDPDPQKRVLNFELIPPPTEITLDAGIRAAEDHWVKNFGQGTQPLFSVFLGPEAGGAPSALRGVEQDDSHFKGLYKVVFDPRQGQ